MASLKDATRPIDTKDLRIVMPPAATPRPALNASADPEFSALSLAPIPPALGTSTDAARQFYRTGVSQVRMFPLPASSSLAVGSQIQTHVQPVADAADFAQKTATVATTTANEASTTATGAATGVATVNAKTVVGIVAGTLQQIPISTLGTSTATPTQDNLNDGTTFGRVVQTALTSNQIDSTKAGFLAKGGSTVPQIVGTTASIFSYTSTTTTVSISWSSFTVFFADNSTTTVSSGSQSATGLTASTTYYFYAYLDASFTVQFVAVSGGHGSPAIMYTPQSPTAAQSMNLQGVTALSSGGISAVTPSSGGGGGTGGGSGRCCRSNSIVLSRTRGEVSISELNVGDEIMGREDWTRIVEHKIVKHPMFVRVTVTDNEATESLQITSTHHITTADGRSVPASQLSLGDLLITARGYAYITHIELIQDAEASKCVLTCEPTHEFLAGDKHAFVLASNQVPAS